MRLYMRPIAPNALKVLVFMAERGIELDMIDVGTLSDEEYRRISPLGMIPVLEADAGMFVSESLTICQYLDAIAPGASLFGDTLDERTSVAMWERRAEIMLMHPAIEYGHHAQPMFADRLVQFPDWARENVKQSAKLLTLMEERLAENPFLATDRFTMADLTAFLGFAGLVGWGAIQPQPGPALGRWLGQVGARPSMTPLYALAAQFGLSVPGT